MRSPSARASVIRALPRRDDMSSFERVPNVVLPEFLAVTPRQSLMQRRVLGVALPLLVAVREVERGSGLARRLLELRRPRHAHLLVPPEGRLDAVRLGAGEALRQDVRVLDRLCGALRLPGLHCVCRVPEQRNATERPVLEWAPHENCAAEERAAAAEVLEESGVPAVEVRE